MQDGPFEYHAPDSLDQAVGLLREHGSDAAPFSGGTDLLLAYKRGTLRARHIVSLAGIPDLRAIESRLDGGLAIGALATLREVAVSNPVRSTCPALAEAAGRAGSPLLRNRGTLGGNVCLDTRCWYFNQSEAWRASRAPCEKAGGDECYVNVKENLCVALFAADTPPALIVAGAEATLAGPDGERTVAVETLYSGDGLLPIARAGEEVLIRLIIPAPGPRSGSAYVKYSVRDSIDFPIVGAAAMVVLAGDGSIEAARVAFTGIRAAPFRIPELEAGLEGRDPPGAADGELTALTAKALGSLWLSDAVPHKRRVAGLTALEAVTRAAERAGAERAA